ncbi:FAD-binding oxidoreductase [Halococcus sp. IIIV-5B]|uniref:FAD-binding oxidoreductase n=1 Tax=Halococcus sp. IIIV-5B TaxID=2321230 RepID=UPI000E758726|nr:FAD-binding oxidoreductase [Halococcus sp. IIIV-5B]RJS97062.1 FAD-binding oxidoreductase [Halococcus sp. IIIV-5B]
MSKAGPPPGGESPTELSAETLEAFAEGFRGELLGPETAGYDEARQVWNGMVNKYPGVIARCTGVADVVAAVTVAREHDLVVAVRGGGHNVAGSALCDGGIVIDLSGMNGVHVDPAARTVRAAGGATLGDVDRETQLFGLATPLGVVSATGIAGLTLNGGIGHLRRKWGLACDNLESVEVVTADGVVRTASRAENPELFWAVRGGGGGVGVVTSFEYRLHEVGPEVFGLFVVHHGDHATEAMHAFREYSASATEDASVLAFTLFVPEIEEFSEAAWGEPAVGFIGCHLGTTEAAESEFDPLRTVAEPVADFSDQMPYTELQTLLDEDYPDGRRYYWKATYVEELTDEILDLVVRREEASPSDLSTIDLWQLGGAIDDPARDETAFWHRENAYMLTFEANWDDPATNDANVAWARDGIAEVREMGVAGGTYGNFPGFEEDPATAQFGGNEERLAAVKAEHDPTNLFG